MLIKEINPEDTWPIRQMVMWPDKPLEFVKIDEDYAGLHFGLFVGGKLSSVISCFETNGEIQFRKFATLLDKQGRGLGSCLLNYVIDQAQSKKINRIWCNARVDKQKFYEKFGLKATSERFYREGIEFVIMERVFDE